MKIIRLSYLLATVFALSACESNLLKNLPEVAKEFQCNEMDRAIPEDPAATGPFAVGVRTINITNGSKSPLTTEVWYPAALDSEEGAEPFVYDMRQFLPDNDAALIPDDGGLDQPCDCYRDLPVDSTQGKLPIIVLVHGTAGFRTASLKQTVHWASRGFIVISADNPNIWLKDLKANFAAPFGATQTEDTVKILEAVHGLNDDLAFLSAVMDPTRIGIAGHSAGARAAGALGAAPGVRVIISMAGGTGAVDRSYAENIMFIGSEKDNVVPYGSTPSSYSANDPLKRLVGISNTGHLTYTELCSLGSEFGGVIPLVKSFGVDVPEIFLRLGTDGCGPEFLDPQIGWDIINTATTLAYEETLQCMPEKAEQFEDFSSRFAADLLEFEQAL